MNEIVAYIHCKKCGETPLGVGFTKSKDLQIWCEDCDKEVLYITKPIT